MMTSEVQIAEVAPGGLREFPGNPRVVREDEPAFRELVDDVGRNGVRTRLICRRLPDGALEVLAGHRRRRAAVLAGVMLVPVEVRAMEDREAIIFVAAENFGRAELRPSEESRAVALLLPMMEEEQVAATLGRSRDWVRTREALPGLGAELMKRLDDGGLPLRVAEDLLRVGVTERAEAVQLMLNKCFGVDPLPAAHACRLLEESFLLPARLEGQWKKLLEPVLKEYKGVPLVVTSVRERADYVEPWGDLVKGWAHSHEELPLEEVMPDAVGLTWKDLALDYGLPLVLVPVIKDEVVTGLFFLVETARVREAAAARAEAGGKRVFLSRSESRERAKVRGDAGAGETGRAGTPTEGCGWSVEVVFPSYTNGRVPVGDLEECLMAVAKGLRDGAEEVVVRKAEG